LPSSLSGRIHGRSLTMICNNSNFYPLLVLTHCSLYRHPEHRSKLYLKLKGLGDPRYVPTSQDMGALISQEAVDDLEVFKKLAHGYTIEGHDRIIICIKNSQARPYSTASDDPCLTFVIGRVCRRKGTSRSNLATPRCSSGGIPAKPPCFCPSPGEVHPA